MNCRKKIGALEKSKDKHIKNAEYELVSKTRDEIDKLQAEKKDLDITHVPLVELEPVLLLLRAVSGRLPHRRLMTILSDQRFEKIRPIYPVIFGPHLKFVEHS